MVSFSNSLKNSCILPGYSISLHICLNEFQRSIMHATENTWKHPFAFSFEGLHGPSPHATLDGPHRDILRKENGHWLNACEGVKRVAVSIPTWSEVCPRSIPFSTPHISRAKPDSSLKIVMQPKQPVNLHFLPKLPTKLKVVNGRFHVY